MAKSKKWSCSQCGEGFKKESQCKAHIGDEHSSSALCKPIRKSIVGQFACYQCKAVFSSKASRKKHGRETGHQDVQPSLPKTHKGHQCKAVFSSKGQRKRHGKEMGHQHVLPSPSQRYQCHQCKKVFKQLSACQAHAVAKGHQWELPPTVTSQSSVASPDLDATITTITTVESTATPRAIPHMNKTIGSSHAQVIVTTSTEGTSRAIPVHNQLTVVSRDVACPYCLYKCGSWMELGIHYYSDHPILMSWHSLASSFCIRCGYYGPPSNHFCTTYSDGVVSTLPSPGYLPFLPAINAQTPSSMVCPANLAHLAFSSPPVLQEMSPASYGHSAISMQTGHIDLDPCEENGPAGFRVYEGSAADDQGDFHDNRASTRLDAATCTFDVPHRSEEPMHVHETAFASDVSSSATSQWTPTTPITMTICEDTVVNAQEAVTQTHSPPSAIATDDGDSDQSHSVTVPTVESSSCGNELELESAEGFGEHVATDSATEDGGLKAILQDHAETGTEDSTEAVVSGDTEDLAFGVAEEVSEAGLEEAEQTAVSVGDETLNPCDNSLEKEVRALKAALEALVGHADAIVRQATTLQSQTLPQTKLDVQEVTASTRDGNRVLDDSTTLAHATTSDIHIRVHAPAADVGSTTTPDIPPLSEAQILAAITRRYGSNITARFLKLLNMEVSSESPSEVASEGEGSEYVVCTTRSSSPLAASVSRSDLSDWEEDVISQVDDGELNGMSITSL
ncbi:hypothetical protein C8Q80DRAFT_1179175 [Daedaleopsis nitida]|nr:hypothetical protein C8Q80DRAFT_1179175 [Daedaleopsis nitida]